MKTLQNTESELSGGIAQATCCQPHRGNARMGLFKRIARSILPAVLVLATAGGALAGPYETKLALLDEQYQEGRISRRSYQNQRADLEIQQAEYNQRNRSQTLDTVKTLMGSIVPFISRPEGPGFGGPGPRGPGPGRHGGPGPGHPGPGGRGPGPGPRR